MDDALGIEWSGYGIGILAVGAGLVGAAALVAALWRPASDRAVKAE
ncbi:MAG TPA: hypothetical protein VNW94_29465 [Streptosporangiaceae bacterium]|nr:hypothetical protein [Streptosporangiaceae bacterium]